jgi:phasin family protein
MGNVMADRKPPAKPLAKPVEIVSARKPVTVRKAAPVKTAKPVTDAAVEPAKSAPAPVPPTPASAAITPAATIPAAAAIVKTKPEAIAAKTAERGITPPPAPITPTIIPARPVAAKPVAAIRKTEQKGTDFMATAADTTKIAAEKVQAMFTDINDRAKTAFEKSAKLGEEVAELTKGNVEAVIASTKVAAKGAETLTHEISDYSKKSLESATAAMKSFAAVKSPTELFQLQSEFAKTAFDTAVSEASKMSETWMKLANEVAQPISNRYAVAVEKMKAAVL